jgi:hypothetical protein
MQTTITGNSDAPFEARMLLLALCKPPTKTRDPKDCKVTTKVQDETKIANQP